MSSTSQSEDAATTSKSRRSECRVITVEPLIAVYSLAAQLFSIHIESSLAVHSTEEDDIYKNILLWQKLQNLNTSEENHINYNIFLWIQLQCFIVPLIMLLALGSYSDDHKLRKPFLLMPILGQLFAIIVYIAFALFTDKFPTQVMVAVNLILPFFGGDLVFMAAFAFLADITSHKTRTFRLGTIFSVTTICAKIFRILNNTLDPKGNPLTVMWITAVLSTCGIIYGIYLIKEPPREEEMPTKALILDAFNPQHVRKTFSVLKKQRPKLLMGILCLIVVRNLVFYGFHADLSWIAEISFDVDHFVDLSLLIRMIGTLIGVFLLVRVLNLDDSIILGLAFISKIASNAVFGYAKTSTMVYVASILDIFSPLSVVALYSMSTKIVSPGDYGKILSLVAIIRITTYSLFANNILPSPALYLGNVLYSLCLPFILWLCIKFSKKEVQTQTNTSDKNDEHEMEEVQI